MWWGPLFRLPTRLSSLRPRNPPSSRFFSLDLAKYTRRHGGELHLWLQKRKVLLRGAMVKNRVLKIPGSSATVPFTISQLMGHVSFLCLGLAYLETDLLNLRLYAMMGIGSSMVFQFYREAILWLPLKWNAVFFVINGCMALVLAIDRKEGESVPEEWMGLYNGLFRARGVKAPDFIKLMNASKRVEYKKGDLIITAGEELPGIFLLSSGRATVRRETGNDTLHAHQFAGAMSYLKRDPAALSARFKQKEMKRAYLDTMGEYTPYQGFIPRAPVVATDATKEQAQALDVGLADVVAEEVCVLFCFRFEDLTQLEVQHPSVALAFERAVSADVTKRFAKRMVA